MVSGAFVAVLVALLLPRHDVTAYVPVFAGTHLVVMGIRCRLRHCRPGDLGLGEWVGTAALAVTGLAWVVNDAAARLGSG
jgi:hypothetical protein